MKITAAIGLLAALPSVFAVWPIPTTFNQGKSNTQTYWVNIEVQGKSSQILNRAVDRYRDIINKESFTAPVDYNRGVLKTDGNFDCLVVSIESNNEDLSLKTDESYTIDVPVSGKATLKAKTPYGAVRGLETFSQLVSANGQSKVITGTPIQIKDAPVYPHRAAMKITAAIGLLAALPSVFAVWPIPTTFNQGKSNTKAYWINIEVDGQSGQVVSSAVERYRNIINKESFTAPVDYNRGVLNTDGDFQGLVVSVENNNEDLGLDTDESYTIDVPVSGKATLKAKTPYGAVRGLETFSQLVSANGQSKVITGTPIQIKDAPVYPHRGILFDTARNFYSLDSIYRTLDAMSYNKLNVFHWHIRFRMVGRGINAEPMQPLWCARNPGSCNLP
ncbi:beta-N-acetylhexosaminidase-like domain-containing protein [Martensiomyces pterosporus]|nr:beta-N-acetylhexosaminidase-like domain-containing protein [Martensiomyces pterosporus]